MGPAKKPTPFGAVGERPTARRPLRKVLTMMHSLFQIVKNALRGETAEEYKRRAVVRRGGKL